MIMQWTIATLMVIALTAFLFALPVRMATRAAILSAALSVVAAYVAVDLNHSTNFSRGTEGFPPPDIAPVNHSGAISGGSERNFTYRVKLIATIDGELRSASALQQVTIRRNLNLGLGSISPVSIRYFGEAVALEVEADRYLLVAMSGLRSQYGYETLIASPCRPVDPPNPVRPPSAENYFSSALPLGQACEVASGRLPLIVALDLTTERPTAMYLSPNDLKAGFASNVEYVSLTFTRVNVPLQFKSTELEDLVQILWAQPPPNGIRVSGVDYPLTLAPGAIQKGN